MASKRAHVFVRGRVQGVGFRYHTTQEAQRHGVQGWVRNLADGRVEATFEGGETDVEHMVRWCQHGPTAAQVDHVDVQWSEATDEFSGFHVRR
ncbi:MAG: acylphosphatase [Anaerolineales bacterium]